VIDFKRRRAHDHPEIHRHFRDDGAGAIVDVYRNLNRPGCWYSVRFAGIVVGWCRGITLGSLDGPEWPGVRLRVGESGRQRVLDEGRKNVHAWVSGVIAPDDAALAPGWAWSDLRYNPRRYSTFVDASGGAVLWARAATLGPGGAAAAVMSFSVDNRSTGT
jgi:hypothetical protein